MNGIIGIVILVLDILAIVDLFKSAKPTGQKVLWTLLIIILPLIGLVLYYLMGRKNQ